LNADKRTIILLFATGAGAGYAPWAPGTIGTLLAVPLSLLLNRIAAVSLPVALLALVAALICAIWLAHKGAEIMRQTDPAVIVVDEIAGFLVAAFLIPPRLLPVTVAFVLFRFFDLVKPFPVATLERLPGGVGIVLDDVMAGLYAFVLLRLFLHWGFI